MRENESKDGGRDHLRRSLGGMNIKYDATNKLKKKQKPTFIKIQYVFEELNLDPDFEGI